MKILGLGFFELLVLPVVLVDIFAIPAMLVMISQTKKNTSDIKDALRAGSNFPQNPQIKGPSPAAAKSSADLTVFMSNPSQAPATAPTVPSHAAFTQQESAPADTSWTCEYCGYTNPRGSFCAVCGKQK